MPLKNNTILAIDDTASIRTFLKISLEAYGAKFIEAASASEGLELFKESLPDLVVLDLGLPDRDGLDILPEIKQYNGEKKPRVIILSVRKEQQTKQRAKELGADAYLTKPFMVEDLMELIHDTLGESS